MTEDEFGLKEKVSKLPTTPGVYQFFDANGVIIYIGKAKNLKNRVSSYFVKTNQTSKTMVLVRKIRDLKYIVVNTEEDALLLENRRGWRVGQIAGCWKEMPGRLRTEGIRIDEAAGTVRVEKGVPDSVRLTLVYTLDGTGALAVAYDLQIAGQLPEPLRAGLRTRVPNTLGRMAYFGKGPQENYSDRSCGAFIGLYRGTPGDFMHDYITPQENGNRCDVRWLEVGSGVKLRVDAVGRAFEAGVHPYTLEELDAAKHSCDLPRHDYLTVNIDGGQQGVGGDVPAVATLKPQYKLPKMQTLTLRCVLQFKK